MEQRITYKFFTSIYHISNTGRIKKYQDGDNLRICKGNGAVILRNNWEKRQINIGHLITICFVDILEDD